MSTSWRNTAVLLFTAAILFGGFAGEKLLAVSGEEQQQLRVFTELLQIAHQSYGDDVAYRDLVYGSIQGLLRSLDPHTSFLTPESYDQMRQRQEGSFFGLGILVSRRNGQLTVISPIEGTPAWRLGLRAGDVISTIEGEPTDVMGLDEAVGKLKGPKDTQVHVQIMRRGLEKPLDLTITRAEIPQNTVRYAYMMNDETGYIRLTDFSRSTAGEMRDALGKLRGEGMQQLILDLRSNGGGLLDQTVAVSNYFVPSESRIVETRGRLPSSYQSYFADTTSEPLDMPVVVLVNNGTASAAEILAGAIQDHDVGLVAGTSTWGKGLVQTVYNLSYGAGLALTTAKYYTPSGRLIQRDYSSFYDYYYYANDDDGDGQVDVDTPDVLAPETPDGTADPEFGTDLGRKVFGGGGITPDVEIELPDGPEGFQILYARNAFFDFAVDYHRRHPVTSEAWQPPADLLVEFRRWLVEEDVLTADEVAEILTGAEADEVATRQIHSDIFTSAFGTEAAHKVTARGDVQIQEALKLFGEANELLRARHDLDGTPPQVASSGADGPAGGGSP